MAQQVSEIRIQMGEMGRAIIYKNVQIYTQGPMFCVVSGQDIYEYPLCNIFVIMKPGANK